jgi:phospholipase/carboxylesterase
MNLEYLEFQKGRSLKPKQLVILIHGYGSNGYDLLSIAPELAKFLPEAHFISPHAPFQFEGGGHAFQWFSLSRRDEDFLIEGAKASEKILDSFIDKQLDRFNLREQDLALIGFSQGSMMILHTALRRLTTVKAVLCYSGMLLAPQLLPLEIKSKPKVMLVHGAEDQVLLPEAMFLAEKALKEAGVECKTVLRPQLGHGIDEEGITLGGLFLKGAFLNEQSNQIKITNPKKQDAR